MPPCRPPRRVVILGAGLSGLTLALRLVELDGRPEVVVVDRRETFERDRTWCAWETGAWPLSSVARTRWHAWRVRAGGRTAQHAGATVPYTCWSSDAVHRHALDRLHGAGGVSVRLGEAVRSVDGATGAVRTDRGGVEADLVVDAMGPGSPLLARTGVVRSAGLVQTFLGWEVETEHPVFDPDVVDLMDFDAVDPVAGYARFLYVLPFSPTRALVEDTTFGPRDLPAARRRRAIERWLDERGAGSWEVLHEERGNLPMSTAAFPARHGPRVWTTGVAGGALRPSSGYALARIQQHAPRLARAIVAGRPVPPPLPGARTRALDAVLLRAVAADPAAAPGWFRDLVARTDAATFARFMSDASSPRDEASVVAAAPIAPFAAAAAAALLDLGQVPQLSRFSMRRT